MVTRKRRLKAPRQKRGSDDLGRHFIKAWRELRRDEFGDEITHGTILAATGISQPTQSRVERFKRPYDQPMLEKLAAFHKCKPFEMLAGPPGVKIISDSVTEKSLILQTINDMFGALKLYGLLSLDEKHRDLLTQLTLAAHELRQDPPQPGTRPRTGPGGSQNVPRAEKKSNLPKS